MTDTPHLHALAMRTAAEGIARQFEQDVVADWISELPLEADHTALLAEAVKLPEIAALIEASKAFRHARLTGDKSLGIYTALNDAISALETP